MNVERAAEIIAAYGGDPARWPDAERMAALQLVEADAGLARTRHAALALDADMTDWAQQSDQTSSAQDDAGDVAARILAERPFARPVRPIWRWAVGTGMAAAIAAGLMLTSPFAGSRHTPASQNAAYRGPASDAAAFAMVFTPTPDEDSSI